MSVVQSTRGTSSYSTSLSCTLGNTPTKGNTLFAFISVGSYSNSLGKCSSITQSGVTWTAAYQAVLPGGSSAPNCTAEIWYAPVTGTGTSTSISCTLNTSNDDGAIIDVIEMNVSLLSSPIDQTASNYGTTTGSSQSETTGTTGTTTQANEILLGSQAIYNSSGSGVGTLSSPQNSFNLVDGSNSQGYVTLAGLWRVVSSTGTYGSAATDSGTPSGSLWTGAIVTLELAAAMPVTFVQHWLW